MRKFRCSAFIIAVTAHSLFAAAQQTPAKHTWPLSDALSQIGISEEGWDATLLKSEVLFGIGKEKNGKEAIAFGTEVPGATSQRVLHVAVRDPKSRRWVDHVIDLSRDDLFRLNVGSIQALWLEPNGTYVETHANPSWSNTALLDKNWKLDHILEGWVVAVLSDGSIVYQKGEPHIAPVHPLELAVYDPNARSERDIYPRTPFGPVRTEFKNELQHALDAIPRDWFLTHNHPDDAEFVTEYLRASYVAHERSGDALIVNSTYDGGQLDPVHFTQDRSRDVEVVAVFRHVNDPTKTQYREFRADALRQQITFSQAADLATPKMLKRIFALPYP